MTLTTSLVTIVFTVAISNVIAKYLKKIPNTYVNLLFGVVLGAIPYFNDLVPEFNNNVFMMGIIAPLLFFEGQGTRNDIIKERAKSILGTAVVLVIVVCIGLTFTINGVFGMSLPFALLLAAVNTPTDITALESVLGSRELPAKLKNTLKTESLFNDATGIVLLETALIWNVTGRLSITDNVSHLLVSFVGGALLGGVISFMIIFIRQALVRSRINVVSSQLTIYLITPFLVYYLAEKSHLSGIIAVVVAGIVHNMEASRSRFSAPYQFHSSLHFVNFIGEILNGSVFVILGISLYRIITEQYNYIFKSFIWLWVGLVIYLVSVLIRWIYARLILKKSRKNGFVFGIGGVHGAVTLALALSLTGIITGEQYSLILLTSTVVIILSMAVPTVVLPIIVPAEIKPTPQKVFERVRDEMVTIGINRVLDMDISENVKESVVYDLVDQSRDNNIHDFIEEWKLHSHRENFTEKEREEERKALMKAFKKEREFLYDVIAKKEIDTRTGHRLYSEILLSESLVLDERHHLD